MSIPNIPMPKFPFFDSGNSNSGNSRSGASKPPSDAGRPASGSVFFPTLVVLLVLLFALVITSKIWTEVAWFSQLEAARVFWTRWGWAFGLGFVGTLIVCLAVALVMFLVRRSVAKDTGKPPRELVGPQKLVWRFLIPLGFGIVLGAPLGGHWQTIVMWLNRTSFGQKDPQFGKDVSFYIFSLPFFHALVSFAIVVLLALAFAVVASHIREGSISTNSSKGFSLSTPARLHFGLLGAGAAVVAGISYWLSRYDLLLADNAKFSGASYTNVNADIPGLTILAIACLLIAVLFIIASVLKRWRLVVTGLAAVVVAALVVTWAYPAIVQRFEVQPNAVEMESEYIQRNIDATLVAYGLDEVEKTNYKARTEAEAGQLRADADTTAQIRLLDPHIVSPAFNQLQQNKQYYLFKPRLNVDRYEIDGVERDTVIAVRELNLDGLSNAQRTWVNDHTVYTHGYGIAAAYGNTTTEQGKPVFFQQGIPSTGVLGDYEPRVYFGESSPEYSIVGAPKGTKAWELDYPDDTEGSNGQVYTTYKGDGGPSIGNVWEKLMYAIRFGSTDIFFSDRVTSQSQILFDRNPAERVKKVAPYLTLDSEVYPAVVDMDGDDSTPKRLVWIIDGYTTSNSYPYSARQTLSDAITDSLTTTSLASAHQDINYIRNSVKAVVDAYDGSVTLYRWDDDDPILKAWDKVFPGMLTPVSKMSGDLLSHVRYPEDLFKVQRSLLAKYHVTDAASFYSGGDFWNVPINPTNKEGDTSYQPPYYLTLQMPGQETAEFSLSTGYVPGGTTKRNVMTGFLAVDANAGNEAGKVREGYGKLRLLELPRDQTVPGPGQAENNFVSNSALSQELNLLRSGGTKVTMGNLLTLPVGGGLLYVQPVYVEASSGTSYPMLQYVLTAFGDSKKIGFAGTLEESLNQTFGGDSGAKAGDAGVSGQKENPGQGGTQGSGDAPASGSAAERLSLALSDAKSAMEASNTAMKNGDWKAYGEAQERLQKALEQAVSAQQEIDAK